jgi:uncharacterized DUF497 family protein
MNNDGFQWDDAKAAANYAQTCVTFEAARDVFKDPFAIEQIDDRQHYREDRWTILGMVEDRLLIGGVHDKRRQHPDHISACGGAL